VETGDEEEEPQELPAEVDVTAASTEDVNFLRAEGFDIDDANLPAPEHIPMENETTTGVHQTWGWSGFSNREAASMQNSPASMTKK
jgi:hypothetical protein